MDQNAERATQWGLQTSYWDALGQHRTAEPEALARLIDALSVHGEPPARHLPKTFIVRQGSDRHLALAAPPDGHIAWTITIDAYGANGAGEGPAIELPADLPIGTGQIRVAVTSPSGDWSEEATLLVTPERAYQGDDGAARHWALAVQLYSVRSRSNWGHGDFSDLATLIDMAADLGAAGIGLNPLHALFDDHADASPYSPSSRLFLNTRYIDVEAVPEFPGLRPSGMDDEIDALREGDRINYAGVVAAKAKALRLAYDVFRKKGSRTRKREFDAFRRDRGATLHRYACFEHLRHLHPGPWWDWPDQWRQPNDTALAELRSGAEEDIAYYEFIQWIADRQLQHCCERSRQRQLPVGLYLDIAVGVRSDGFDAWSEQASIMSAMEIGAPPDLLNTAGQKWGLAGVNPVMLEAQAFEPFRRALQTTMRYSGAVRIDHVLGLNRIYLVPSGMSADKGVYIQFPFRELLAVIAQESIANKCIVIGEDLGTVPERFRETLSDFGIWSYRVLLFERDDNGSFRAPDQYGKDALVTFATHDLPTYTGWLSFHDLGVKRNLGIDPGETDNQRHAALGAFRDALAKRSLATGEETPGFLAVASYLAATPSRLLVVSMEDVLGIRDQVNLPGTIDEHPNWLQRLPASLDDLDGMEVLAQIAEIMAGAGRRS
jgi:4-alpha-glucanotransferase